MQNLEGYLNTCVLEILGKYLQTSKFNFKKLPLTPIMCIVLYKYFSHILSHMSYVAAL